MPRNNFYLLAYLLAYLKSKNDALIRQTLPLIFMLLANVWWTDLPTLHPYFNN